VQTKIENNNQSEIKKNLEVVFTKLLSSKKLIITVTLAITLLGSYFNFQQPLVYTSNANIQIGNFNSLQEGTEISTSNKLILDILVNFVYKNHTSNLNFSAVKIEPLVDNRLIKISHKSHSPELNKKILNEIVAFVENSHLDILNSYIERNKKDLTYKIQNKENEMKFIKKELLANYEDSKKELEFVRKQLVTKNENDKNAVIDKIRNIDKFLPIIARKTDALKKISIEDESNLSLLKSSPEIYKMRAAQSPTLEQIIFSYNEQIIELEAEKERLAIQKSTLESKLKLLENSPLESEIMFRLIQEIAKLKNELKLIENNPSESKRLFKLLHEKNEFELKLNPLLNKNYLKTQLTGEITTESKDNKKFFILISFLIGLLLSILIVYIDDFSKTFRENLNQ
jgi:uncharacterized protein involved in exopolysaccharide biosynthesis